MSANSDEIKQEIISADPVETNWEIFVKVLLFLTGTGIGLGVVWFALQIIPAAAISAVSGLGS